MKWATRGWNHGRPKEKYLSLAKVLFALLLAIVLACGISVQPARLGPTVTVEYSTINWLRRKYVAFSNTPVSQDQKLVLGLLLYALLLTLLPHQEGVLWASAPLLGGILAKLSGPARNYLVTDPNKLAAAEAKAKVEKERKLPLAYAYGFWPEEEEPWFIEVANRENRMPKGFLLDGLLFHNSGAKRINIERNIGHRYMVINGHVNAEGLKDLINCGMERFGIKWVVNFAVQKDSDIGLILTDEKDALPTDYTEFAAAHLGLELEMKEYLQAYPTSKYCKRYLAPQLKQRVVNVEKIESIHEDCKLVTVSHKGKQIVCPDGKTDCTINLFRIAFVKNQPEIDAAGWMTERMAQVLYKINAGSLFAVMMLSRLGLTKGHVLVVPNDYPLWAGKADMVVSDTKGIIWGSNVDEVIVSMLADKHGKPYANTDLQSVTNMDLWKFLRDWVNYHVTTFLNDVKDGAINPVESDEHFGRICAKAEELGLADFRPLRIPALLRRLWGSMAHKLSRMSKKGRKLQIQIPNSATAYMMVHPHVVDANFRINHDTCPLRGDVAWLDSMESEFAAHRQPNAGWVEAIHSTLVKCDGLDWLVGTGVILFSPDVIAKYCKIMGGGDQDDALVIYKEQRVVDHFKQLIARVYPGGSPEKAVKPEPRAERYCASVVMQLMDSAVENGGGIGAFVNPIMWFNAMLLMTPNYVTEFVANLMGTLCRGLETIIDNVVKTGESNKRFTVMVEKFMEVVPVCPRFLADRFGRLSEDGRFVTLRNQDKSKRRRVQIVDTFADRTLQSIEYLVSVYRVAMDRYSVSVMWSWRNWSTARKLAGMNISPAAAEAGEAIHAYYQASCRERMNAMILEGVSEDNARRLAATAAQLDVYLALRHAWGTEPVMAYLWKKSYSQVNSHTGDFSDGLLWGEAMYELTLNMLARIDRERTEDADPCGALMQNSFIASRESDVDYDRVARFMAAAGQTVHVIGHAWEELDHEAKPVKNADGKAVYVISPFTNKPVVKSVELVFGNGAHHANLVDRMLKPFLATVQGSGKVTGTLHPYMLKSQKPSAASQWLVLNPFGGSTQSAA